MIGRFRFERKTRISRDVAGLALPGGCCKVPSPDPYGGAIVAGITLGRGGQMAGRLGLGVFRQVSAIVASRALAVEAGVIHGAGSPIYGAGVAGIARKRSRDMGCPLLLCVYRGVAAVVTGGTLTCSARVTHGGRRKSRIVLVASVALQGCRNMCSRLGQP